ncbi:MAG: hypothetical protein M3478_02595, partial [Planctomycetota bacterium]|nr:hypothetical protein [Planctomycetota bacterium]
PDAGGDDGAVRVVAIARFNTNGTADTNFGIGGAVTRGFDVEASGPSSIAVRQTDGLIAVSGTDGGPDANVLVLNPDGTQARAADGNSFVRSPRGPGSDPPQPTTVLWDRFGRLLVIGSFDDDTGDFTDVYVTRYTSGGILDTSFSGDGFTTFRAPGSSYNIGNAAAFGGNGNLLITGATIPMVDDPAPRYIITARVVNNDVPTNPTPLVPSIAIESGVLVARGTGGNDIVTLRRTGTDDVIVTVNALSRQFDMDNFSGIRFEGLAGTDVFRLIDPITTSTLARQTTVLGGEGIDTVDYATRSQALSFNGLFQADASIPGPYVEVVSGTWVDRLSDDVEQIRGSGAMDTFDVTDPGAIGSGVAKLLSGGAGNDWFITGPGPQHTLAGGAGNDTFRVAGGVPWIEGGAGDDVIRMIDDAFIADINAGVGLDALDVSDSTRDDHDIEDRAGIENIVGIGRRVVMNIGGNTRNNLITTAGGFAGAGGQFTVRVRSGDGNDTVIGGSAADELSGGSGNDSLVGNAGDDTLDGGADSDTLAGGSGTNLLLNGEVTSGDAPISIVITNRVLTATGSSLGDTITVRRTGTDDVIVQINSVQRQFDMDNFDGILIRGLDGEDSVSILDAVVAGSLSRKVTIEGGAGVDRIDGSDGDEVMRGGDGGDYLRGFGGADALFGQAGNDHLLGGDGQDFIDGGDSDDELFSDDDTRDTVLGGNGTDVAFVDSLDQVSGVEDANA